MPRMARRLESAGPARRGESLGQGELQRWGFAVVDASRQPTGWLGYDEPESTADLAGSRHKFMERLPQPHPRGS